MSPKLWILPPRIITESFVAVKLIALSSFIDKYEALAGDTDSLVSPHIGYLTLELNRIEDILVEFFENCELGRSGYLLVNPIREHTGALLDHFHQFVEGRLVHRTRNPNSTVDDLAALPQNVYRSLNARRSHSVNCIEDFKKFVREKNEEEEDEFGVRRRTVQGLPSRRVGEGGVLGRRRSLELEF